MLRQCFLIGVVGIYPFIVLKPVYNVHTIDLVLLKSTHFSEVFLQCVVCKELLQHNAVW